MTCPRDWKKIAGGLAYFFKWNPEAIWSLELWPYNELEFWDERMGEIAKEFETEAEKRKY